MCIFLSIFVSLVVFVTHTYNVQNVLLFMYYYLCMVGVPVKRKYENALFSGRLFKWRLLK